jgi:hypothetical protein
MCRADIPARVVRPWNETGSDTMTFLWLVAVAALAAAILGWRQARQSARRLEQLSQMYWELKYQHGELRVQLQRLTSPDGQAGAPRQTAAPGEAAAARPTDGFIPLSSLKR